MASPAYSDIYINQGEDFTTQITLYDDYGNPYNLSGFSVASQAKKSYYTQNTAIVFNATVYDAANGIIQLNANNSITANLDARQKLVYDVYVTDATGLKTRVLEGQILVSPGVTIANTAYGLDV